MPPFPRKLLADHEKIVFDLKPHWIALAGPVLWTVALLAVVVFGRGKVNDMDEGTVKDGLNWIVLIGPLAGIAYLGVLPFLKWATTHFVLTSDRLITRHGIVARNSREIPLERINDVSFNQSVFERMLGAGDLMIESAGERGQSRITNVRKPEEVQLMIYKETEENNNRMMRPGAPAAAAAAAPAAAPATAEASVTDQIEALARLKDQGALTEMEFENKKQELLKRL